MSFESLFTFPLFILNSKEVFPSFDYADLHSPMISKLITVTSVLIPKYQCGSAEKQLRVHISLEILCFVVIVVEKPVEEILICCT